MGDLSITALYTSAVWSWANLPSAHLFATVDAKRVFAVTNAALLATRTGNAPLRYALLHRHTMIDHLLRDSKFSRVIELAAGLSPRGAAFSADPGVRYTEIDLPAVVAHKRQLLSRTAEGRAVLARDNFELVAGDVETVELDASEPVFVIAEGLAMYLDAAARGRLFAKLRRLADHADLQFVFDLVPSSEEPPAGLGGRILEAAMKRFTGGRTFERDARTRADIVGELRAAGFDQVEAIASADVATRWGLPEAGRRTLMVVFTASVRTVRS